MWVLLGFPFESLDKELVKERVDVISVVGTYDILRVVGSRLLTELVELGLRVVFVVTGSTADPSWYTLTLWIDQYLPHH